jgi:hypothetical protein
MMMLLGTSKMKYPSKRAGGGAEGRGGHAKVAAHRQAGEADVDPVDIGQK